MKLDVTEKVRDRGQGRKEAMAVETRGRAGGPNGRGLVEGQHCVARSGEVIYGEEVGSRIAEAKGGHEGKRCVKIL